MENKRHVFEERGLGKAPFVYDGFFQGQMHPTPQNPNVTFCHYCGAGIVNCFKIKSSDGKSFVVGSECVKKTGDKGLYDFVQREVRKQKAIAEWEKWLELKGRIMNRDKEVVEKLDTQRHPFMGGKTMYDYADYIATHGGYDSSIKRIFKALR